MRVAAIALWAFFSGWSAHIALYSESAAFIALGMLTSAFLAICCCLDVWRELNLWEKFFPSCSVRRVNTDRAELLLAYRWYCPACDEENFAASQVAEMTDDEREDCYREIHELEDWQELPDGWERFSLVSRPDAVKCQDCGEWFDTQDDAQDDSLGF